MPVSGELSSQNSKCKCPEEEGAAWQVRDSKKAVWLEQSEQGGGYEQMTSYSTGNRRDGGPDRLCKDFGSYSEELGNCWMVVNTTKT